MTKTRKIDTSKLLGFKIGAPGAKNGATKPTSA